MLEAVIFDVDGVIVDSEQTYFEVVREVFRPYGVDIDEKEYVRRWMIEQTTTPGVIRDYNLNVSVEEIRARKAVLLDIRIAEVQLMPHARELIEELYLECPLAVVSSAKKSEVLKKIGKFDLVELFQAIIAGEDTERKKPFPDPYQKAVELLGVNPQYVVVIEDNPSGVIAGKSAGCKLIAYPNGFTKGMDFSHADAVVGSLSEVNDSLLYRLTGK